MDEAHSSGKGRFQAGNPGRRRGSKNKRPALLSALDQLAAGAAPGILNVIAKAALDGDMRAAEIIMRRAWPEPKGRPVSVELPALRQPGDLAAAAGDLIGAVAAGELTPD